SSAAGKRRRAVSAPRPRDPEAPAYTNGRAPCAFGSVRLSSGSAIAFSVATGPKESDPVPVSIVPAVRIRRLPPYLFAEIDRMKKEVAARGDDLISLGIGDPDSPTFPHIVAALQEAAARPANPRYPDYEGMPSFRAAAA